MTTVKIIITMPYSITNPRDKRATQNNLNSCPKKSTSKNITKNGGSKMQANPKIIYLNSRNYDCKNNSLTFKKTLRPRPASTSLFGMLMAQGYIPKSYGKTISQYEILRNFSLSDGPQKPRCLLQNKPKVHRKYTHTYVREVDVVQAEKIQKLWQDSAHILQSYKCKDMVDMILRMEGVANKQVLLSLQEIHNLRCGLRDLTRYYGQKMVA